MIAQRDSILTFFSDFRFLLNNLTEPNKKSGKVLGVNFLKKTCRCLFMNTAPMYHWNCITYSDKKLKYFSDLCKFKGYEMRLIRLT